MKKYFINYEDLMEDNKLGKTYDIYSPEIFIIRKNKFGKYNFEPILYFADCDKNLSNYAMKLNYTKKGILMVNLTEEEAKLFDPLFVKEYTSDDGRNFVKSYKKSDKTIKLLNYGVISYLSDKEYNEGNIVVMMPCQDNREKMYVSADRSVLAITSSIKERRNFLNRQEIGCDLYFHTEEEKVLEKYNDHLTELEEIGYHQYKVISQSVFVIDSIPSDRIYNLSKNNYKCLDSLIWDAINVSIRNYGDNYKLDIHSRKSGDGKGYIINYDTLLRNLYNSNIEPFLKYINVYELVDDYYKKISLYEYLDKKDILKYIKKPDKR